MYIREELYKVIDSLVSLEKGLGCDKVENREVFGLEDDRIKLIKNNREDNRWNSFKFRIFYVIKENRVKVKKGILVSISEEMDNWIKEMEVKMNKEG